MNYLDLFANQKFEELVALDDSAISIDVKFLKFRSFIALNKMNLAFQYYDQNKKEFLNYSFVETIKLFIYIKVSLKSDILETINACQEFKDYPYKNIETEEFLNNLDSYISKIYKENIDKDTFKENNSEILIEKLHSNNYNDVIFALNEIGKKERSLLFDPKEEMIKLLENDPVFTLSHGLIFATLIELDIDHEFLVVKDEKYLKANPHNLYVKFHKQKRLLDIKIEDLEEHEKNVSIMYVTSKIMDISSYYLFPNYIEENDDADAFFYASLSLAYKLLKDEISDDYFYFEFRDEKLELINFYYTIIKKVITQNDLD